MELLLGNKRIIRGERLKGREEQEQERRRRASPWFAQPPGDILCAVTITDLRRKRGLSGLVVVMMGAWRILVAASLGMDNRSYLQAFKT